ncbi:oxidoreductase-like domain-containing protein [Polaromonas sp.]|uniref:oxidoreductase-like domain-containing protein n=1 Tax=Polaromonas sp. TaxID=1869339 RepID=UPI002FC76F3F
MLTRVTDLPSARQLTASLSALADQQGLSLRPPPPEPTTCCGRGCNGCVWEGWFAAVEYWREEALQKLEAGRAG